MRIAAAVLALLATVLASAAVNDPVAGAEALRCRAEAEAAGYRQTLRRLEADRKALEADRAGGADAAAATAAEAALVRRTARMRGHLRDAERRAREAARRRDALRTPPGGRAVR